MRGSRAQAVLASTISQRSDRESAEERRRAVRILLVRPLLCAGGDDAGDFSLVRKHVDFLRTFFSKHLGWTLEVDSGLARLRKVPADLWDGTRPARDVHTGIPFSRRRYVLLCLALCALERAERQTTLGRLAEQIVQEAQAEALSAAGMTFDLKSQDQRRDLVTTVRFLLSMRVLVRVQGDEQQFLSERGDVLYDVERPALVALVNLRRPPSLIRETDWSSRLAALSAEPRPDTPEGRNQFLRVQLMRRLIDDPVLYYSELTEDERTYLTSQRPFLTRTLEENTGLIPEARAEGLLFCDDRGDCTDFGIPEEGTRGHLALLLAEFLASRLRTQGDLPIPHVDVVRHVEQLIAQHKSHWSREATQPGAGPALAVETLERLEALRLVRRADGSVIPRPAIARYALAAPVKEARKDNAAFTTADGTSGDP